MSTPEIDLIVFEELHATGVVVIDVREPDEWSDGRVPGAIHMPLATVPERLDEVPTDVTVYVVCAMGGRSARAVEYLRANGIDAINVAGGTMGWIDGGRPVERD